MLDDPEAGFAVGRFDVRFLQRPEHVDAAGVFGRFALDGGVAIDADEIQHVGEIEMIETPGERAEIVRDGDAGRQLVQQIGLHFDKSDDGITGEPQPVQQQRGVIDRRRLHGHGHVFKPGDDLRPEPGAHEFVQALDRFVFGFQPRVPVAPRLLVERGFGVVPADSVFNLPGDELRVLAEGGGEFGDDFLAILPIDAAVHAIGLARALVLEQATLVEREDFRMLSCQPDGRGGGRGAKHDLDAGVGHDIHCPLHPGEIVFAFLRFVEAPGELAHAHHVDAGGDHQFGIALPAGLWFFRSASVRIDPMLRIIISAEIHRLDWLDLTLV